MALAIRVAPLMAGLLAGLFVIALVTQAYKKDGTLRIGPMVRSLLIITLASVIVFPREYFGIGVNSVALLMAFILFSLAAPSQGLKLRPLVPYLIFTGLFVLATAIHLVGGGGFDDSTAFRALAIGLLGSFLMANYFNSAEDLKPLFMIMLPVLVFAAVLSVVQALTGQNYLVGDLYNRSGQDRLVAFGFGSNNVLHGMSMMAGLIISAYFYLTVRRMKWLFLVAAALVVAGLVISSSQAVWGGALVTAAIMVFLTGGRAKAGGLLTLIVVIGLAGFVVFKFEQGGAFSAFSGLAREGSAESSVALGGYIGSDLFFVHRGSLTQRLDYWADARQLFTESPVWGIGFTEFEVRSINASETHNVYLSWLTETGLFGLVGFVVMLGMVFARAIRVARHMDPESRLALQLLASLLAGYLFTGIFWHIEIDRLFWLSIGLVGGLTGYRGLADQTSEAVASHMVVPRALSDRA